MLEDLKLPEKKQPCRVRTLKAELSEKDAEIFEQSVMNPEWPYKTLSNELKKRGVSIADTGIKFHRMKECSCWKI